MALSENTSGSQTATVTTEHTLATISASGVYQLRVDLDNMANGDITEIRIKVQPRSSPTTRLIEWYAVFADDQGTDNQLVISPPIPSVYSIEFTLKQTTGTGRAYAWSVLEY